MIPHMKIGREEVHTLVEAGQISGLSPNTLRAQIKNGVLPAVKVGKTFLVRTKDLDRYIRDHKGRAGRPRQRTKPQEPK
jgi:excisionase family DNA binding protein